jgi:hypothetical protein
MTKSQAMRYMDLSRALEAFGVGEDELDALLRCERTLSRWACRECGDGSDWAIEREGEDGEGRPFNVYHGPGERRRYPIADLERGALARAEKIATRHGLTVYHQGDPRGCALYLLRPGDVPAGACVTGCYTRGIAVCID